MKLNSRHVTILVLLIVASVLFGFAYNGIATAVEHRNYPRPEQYREAVTANAEAFGIPEAVLWALIREESGFNSAKNAAGRIGLLQISPEQFSDVVARLLPEESDDPARLYDPQINLRAGSALLSDLYDRYGGWKTVFAAWYSGVEETDLWLADSQNLDAKGNLKSIPDKKAAAFVASVEKARDRYTALYPPSRK